MEQNLKPNVNKKCLLIAGIGHLLCWIGGDLLLYFQPSGFLDVKGLFDYDKQLKCYKMQIRFNLQFLELSEQSQ